ncbi:hypothetical protein GCM10010106_04210 [Thermopolyspora flexuosa]|jgi:hypothetical protein|uniref:DUF2945 family protein n=1 Tax=Thermopolyspora flexuosa TaxID=103836 RepID=A0A543IYQ3_9ACTN|nr:DUF2945 domain-containing protein [Thermopolyspora flexuosa]TQM75706.1 DUF2945 family protein [Thermopolyspora flexuosa]GGM61399.1 hypothetical protein GCM10010106_04210 [Thermopolyspora flexuosa]
MAGRRKREEPGVGDEVTWRSHGSTTSGKVEKKLTERTEEAGRTVNASPEDPQYRVRSDKSGKSAVHKPSALHPKKGKDSAG